VQWRVMASLGTHHPLGPPRLLMGKHRRGEGTEMSCRRHTSSEAQQWGMFISPYPCPIPKRLHGISH
jgi:hypothetical protein